MATKILFKKSSTGGSTPSTADLDQGEFAVNLADRKVYTKDSSNNIVTLGTFVSSTQPTSPVEGDLWYDTANNILKSYNGGSFDSLTSTTGTVTSIGLTVGSGLDVTNSPITTSGNIQLDLDLSEFTDMTETMVNTDEFIVLDAGTQKRKAASEIGVSVFNNDANYSTTTGTVTSVDLTAGNLIDVSGGPVTSSGSIQVDVDLSELTDMTDAMVGTDEFVLLDAGAQKRKAASEIDLSIFDNTTSGFISSYTETQTLDDVTTLGSTTTNSVTVGGLTVNGDATIDSDLTVTGNLTVSGTTTTVNSNEVNIGDSIILLNSDIDVATAPSEDGGIAIKRGSAATKTFKWNETDDAWDLESETLQNVSLDGGSY